MKQTNPIKNWFEKIRSAEEQEQTKNKSHVPFRLNFLFFVIFALFVLLVGRLGYLQIVKGSQMRAEMNAATVLNVKGSTPRGMIYDSKGSLLVKNQANPAIIFTRGNTMTAKDIYTVANKLNELIDVPVDDNLTTRDKKDYWLGNPDNLKKAEERLSFKEKNLDTSNEYKKLVDKVTAKEIQLTETQQKAATIFKRMGRAAALSTVFIKNNGVTDAELATVAERIADLPGVSTGTDWTRGYDEHLATSLRSILGKVSTETEGLPAENVDEYLKKGYSRNDRVGTSYLEKQYEDVLQGKKSELKITLDQQGTVKKQEEVKTGEKGANLMLTIDSEFQNQVEGILKTRYQELVNTGEARYSPGVYAVVMNPTNGDVLAMTGFSHQANSGTLEENALGAMSNSFEPGSVVKGGSVTAGYQSGVISGNDVLIDEPIKIAGTALKASIYNKTIGHQMPLSTVKALEYSSNAYMMQIVLRMLGVTYSSGMTLPESANSEAMFDKLRKPFAEYGMGVKTGIDLPNESSGLVNRDFGTSRAPTGGNLLDLSFGQYDTYTAMQLAQYASTVANGGTRISPHVVKGIYENGSDGGLGTLEKEITGKKLNQVKITPEQMGIIREGFYQVVHGSDPGLTTGTDLRDVGMDVSAKTGTAETSVPVNGQAYTTINSNIVAYGPSNAPKVAVSVMLPNLSKDSDKTNKFIARDILNAYVARYGVN